MMLKQYMLIIFKRGGSSKRSVTDKSPLQRAIELHGKCNDIEEIEVYKYVLTLRDYKYLCTIKFDRILLREFE